MIPGIQPVSTPAAAVTMPVTRRMGRFMARSRKYMNHRTAHAAQLNAIQVSRPDWIEAKALSATGTTESATKKLNQPSPAPSTSFAGYRRPRSR